MKPLLTITLFLFALSLHAGVTVYSAPDETGLVGYWKMDEPSPMTIDYSGNGNSGTNVGGATLTNGVVGNAFSFDGSNQYIGLNSSICDFTNSQPYTLSLWYKSRTNNPSSAPQLLAKRTGCSGASIQYAILDSISSNGGGITFEEWDSSRKFIASGVQGPFNSWIFITFTYNGLVGSLYTNANLVASSNFTFSANHVVGNLTINNAGTCTGHALGLIDEVRIYNRALSATEITNLYNFRQTTYLTNGATPYKP